jgi:hypothetical protein
LEKGVLAPNSAADSKAMAGPEESVKRDMASM